VCRVVARLEKKNQGNGLLRVLKSRTRKTSACQRLMGKMHKKDPKVCGVFLALESGVFWEGNLGGATGKTQKRGCKSYLQDEKREERGDSIMGGTKKKNKTPTFLGEKKSRDQRVGRGG